MITILYFEFIRLTNLGLNYVLYLLSRLLLIGRAGFIVNLLTFIIYYLTFTTMALHVFILIMVYCSFQSVNICL